MIYVELYWLVVYVAVCWSWKDVMKSMYSHYNFPFNILFIGLILTVFLIAPLFAPFVLYLRLRDYFKIN